MKEFLTILAEIVVAGVIVLLCLFSCFLSSFSDEYWEEVKRELEKNKNERH